jgi:hypothetical protein
MKANGGRDSIKPPILNFVTRRRYVKSFKLPPVGETDPVTH